VLLQSLLVIATTVVLASTILLSALVSAKTSLHQEMTRKAETAAADGTAAFVAWAQSIMAKNALTNSNDWPTKPPAPIREELCAPGTLPPGGKCAFVAATDWTVTGKSATSDAAGVWATSSLITNASTTLDEQRISATITTTVTSRDHNSTASERTRQLTLRTLQANPYIVVTGVHDENAAYGTTDASEGDTAGFARSDQSLAAGNERAAPDSARPSDYTNTTLRAEATCTNSFASDGADPYKLRLVPAFKHLRKYGNADWAFESQCKPKYRITENLPKPTWSPPPSEHFLSDYASTFDWSKDDANLSGFEH